MYAGEFLEDILKKEEICFGEKSQEYYNSLINSWTNDNNNSRHRFDTIKLFLPYAVGTEISNHA